MVCAHQRRSSFVDFTNATVVGPNRSNNCRMVCVGQRHPSHQPTDHRPITVQNFRDAWLTQIGDPLSAKMAKVDAEHKTWARPATGYGGALLGKTACSTGRPELSSFSKEYTEYRPTLGGQWPMYAF